MPIPEKCFGSFLKVQLWMKKESIGIVENLWTMDGVEKVGAPLFLTISIFIHCKNFLNATSLSSSIVTFWVHANVRRVSLNKFLKRKLWECFLHWHPY
jgi:hypothetical protein